MVSQTLCLRRFTRSIETLEDDKPTTHSRDVVISSMFWPTEVVVVTVPAPTTLKSGRGALARLLNEAPGLDAVFCSSDLLALGVLTEAQVSGMPVPGQLAVVGFGDLALAADVHPALTTVHIKGAAIGRQAAQFIVDRAEGRAVAERVVDIGFSIVEREST